MDLSGDDRHSDGYAPQDEARTLYARADRMLYEAKSGGRNRCCWEETLQA